MRSLAVGAPSRIPSRVWGHPGAGDPTGDPVDRSLRSLCGSSDGTLAVQVGWIKRGPTGILGTNKRDAEETVGCLAEDLASGALRHPPNPGREQIDGLLAERRPDLVTIEGWRGIDAHELRKGHQEQRPRVKLASRDALLAAAGTASPTAALS